MSLEDFMGFEGGEGMNDAAFEKFKERMAKAQAQIAAIRKEEKKQKKKEEELVKILLKFVKTSHKKDLTLLISRALEQNIPANFVLAIILLGNEDIQRELGSFLMLKEGESRDISGYLGTAPSDEKSLIFFREDETLPLKVKIELDTWLKGMLFQAEENPHKLLKTAYDITFEEDDFGDKQEKREIKTVLIQLVAFVIRDYLEQNKIEEEYKRLRDFAHFALKGILDRTRENLDDRKFIEA